MTPAADEVDGAEEEIDLVTLVRRAVHREDHVRAADLIARYPLEIWFGVVPSEFQVILECVGGEVTRSRGWGRHLLRAFMSRGAAAAPDAGRADAPDAADARLATELARFSHACDLRLRGDPVEALSLMRELTLVHDPVPQLLDPTRGQRALVLLQAGLTAMLAGELTEALTLFEKSLLFRLPKALAFFSRDAHLRSALIQALYGSPERARIHLALSREQPRTNSWVEQILDGDEALLKILLRPATEADDAFSQLAQFPLAHMQELWPFHLAAAQRIGLLGGQMTGLRERIAQFSDVGLTGAEGTGFVGSVIGHGLAIQALLAGAITRAEDLLATTAPQLWQTSMIGALIALSRGAPRRAVRMLRGTAAGVRGLEQAENVRLAILAMAHEQSSDDEELLTVLTELAPRIDPFAHALLRSFSPALESRASQSIQGWPRSPAPLPTRGALQQRALTTRELDVLVELARGRSRSDIARSLFITLNTVKTHQRSLYRKLEVSTREEAIREARRRALL